MEHTYRIAVYDNRVDSMNLFIEMIKKIMHKNQINSYSVHAFINSMKLYHEVIDFENRYDIYFFRIYDREKTIMDYAELFRSKDIWESFVYIIDNTYIPSNGYKVKLMDYLFEPINMNLLEKLILYDYENNFSLEYIPLKKNSRIFYIKMKDLVCVEVYGRGIKLYLSDTTSLNFLSQEHYLREDINMIEKSLRYTEKLSDFKQKLNPRIFLQCHQSFIVNVNKIISMKRYQAILYNKTLDGITADVSKKYWNDIRKRFMENMTRKQEQRNLISDEDLEQVAGGRKVVQGNLVDDKEILNRKKEGD